MGLLDRLKRKKKSLKEKLRERGWTHDPNRECPVCRKRRVYSKVSGDKIMLVCTGSFCPAYGSIYSVPIGETYVSPEPEYGDIPPQLARKLKKKGRWKKVKEMRGKTTVRQGPGGEVVKGYERPERRPGMAITRQRYTRSDKTCPVCGENLWVTTGGDKYYRCPTPNCEYHAPHTAKEIELAHRHRERATAGLTAEELETPGRGRRVPVTGTGPMSLKEWEKLREEEEEQIKKFAKKKVEEEKEKIEKLAEKTE